MRKRYRKGGVSDGVSVPPNITHHVTPTVDYNVEWAKGENTCVCRFGGLNDSPSLPALTEIGSSGWPGLSFTTFSSSESGYREQEKMKLLFTTAPRSSAS
eukprot:Hpha_TRINITY_DN34200_c0_g1::TRINITY_DN34200_c0_g1_i1::g.34468::m.34468